MLNTMFHYQLCSNTKLRLFKVNLPVTSTCTADCKHQPLRKSAPHQHNLLVSHLPTISYVQSTVDSCFRCSCEKDAVEIVPKVKVKKRSRNVQVYGQIKSILVLMLTQVFLYKSLRIYFGV